MQSLKFFIEGIPQPKGSMKSFAWIDRASGKARSSITHGSSETKYWQNWVSLKIKEVFHAPPSKGPIWVNLCVFVPRPKTISEAKRKYPTVPPDHDKYTRCILDAMTGIVYVDDSQVVGKIPTLPDGKFYAGTNYDEVETRHQPGVEITVRGLQ